MINWKWFGRKRSWPDFKLLPRNLHGGTDENHEDSHHSRSPGLVLKPGPSEYEAGVLTTLYDVRQKFLSLHGRSWWSTAYLSCHWTQGSRVQTQPRTMDFLMAIKIRRMTSFGVEVKPSVPYRKVLQHVKCTLQVWKRDFVDKIDGHFSPSFSCFAARCPWRLLPESSDGWIRND
jgi:hypothetical protein